MAKRKQAKQKTAIGAALATSAVPDALNAKWKKRVDLNPAPRELTYEDLLKAVEFMHGYDGLD